MIVISWVSYDCNFMSELWWLFQDEEMLLFEKEKKEAENNLRKRLALETEAALAQQEKELAALIGRFEVRTKLNGNFLPLLYWIWYSAVLGM